MKVILIHGYKSSSQGNFFPWLSLKLRDLGHDVVCVDLPGGESPDPDVWIETLLGQVKYIDNETIILGHSLGATTALRFLEAAEVRSTPKGCILVAPPWMIKNEIFSGFFLSELDFDVLMWKASRFVVMHSKDDKVIPADHAKKYARVLHAKLVETEGDGHFQGAEYQSILDEIQLLVGDKIVYAPGKSLDDAYGELHER